MSSLREGLGRALDERYAVRRGIGILLALVFLATPVAAQEHRLGFVGGVTVATWGGDDADDFDSTQGFDLGAYLSWAVGETWAIRPGVYYVQKGNELSNADGDFELDLAYVEIPVLLEYRIPMPGALNVHLLAGPALAFKVGCDLELSGRGIRECDDVGLDVKGVDLGSTIGLGLQLGAGEGFHLVVETNYTYGFVSVDDTGGDADVTNRALQVNAGVSFPVGH